MRTRRFAVAPHRVRKEDYAARNGQSHHGQRGGRKSREGNGDGWRAHLKKEQAGTAGASGPTGMPRKRAGRGLQIQLHRGLADCLSIRGHGIQARQRVWPVPAAAPSRCLTPSRLPCWTHGKAWTAPSRRRQAAASLQRRSPRARNPPPKSVQHTPRDIAAPAQKWAGGQQGQRQQVAENPGVAKLRRSSEPMEQQDLQISLRLQRYDGKHFLRKKAVARSLADPPESRGGTDR